MDLMSPDLARQATLSIPRMDTYLSACAGRASPLGSAIELYTWNSEVSAAFMHPLHFCEVVIRNAVSDALATTYGAQWPWEKGFLLSLPNPSSKNAFKPREALIKARNKALASAGGGNPSTGKVIAEMNFAFWESMFTKRNDPSLWQNQLLGLFPNAPSSTPYYVLRGGIYTSLYNIRMLRNRIAHHEPIFSRNLEKDYMDVLSLIGYRCKHTAELVDQVQLVKALLARKP